MAELPVLRFPISGQDNGSFLVEVSSNGSRPLDIKLIGSESTAVFVIKLRHKKVVDYKADPGHCTDEEWEQILTSTFVDLKPVPDIEIRADVQSDGSSVTLSFRKNIQGITQRLGSINLDENDRTEISPFDWCVSAIESRVKVTEELAAATAKIDSLQHSIEELKAQLEEFISTKEEDETEMLEKFQDLLNSKKLKIRQQLRLLAAANVDPKKLAHIGGDEGQDDAHHRNAGPSRSGKRKAAAVKEEDDDDGFERMDVDNNGGSGDNTDTDTEADEDQDDRQSTDNDATESDPATDDEPPTAAEIKRKGVPAAAGRITKPKAAVKKKQPTARASQTTRAAKAKQAAAESEDEEEDKDDDDDEMPPPRVLPFMANKKAAAPPPKPVDDDDETQSDEDSEL
ncbi:hypothetical protein F5Y08DRAFT_209975 [Xylaria arbuscula]|nr:hypothetical protein F5Y08DRAFT_209975 [Xylaria arbuscula]